MVGFPVESWTDGCSVGSMVGAGVEGVVGCSG